MSEPTALIESEEVDDVRLDQEGLIRALLDAGFTVHDGGDNARIWLRPKQELPRNLLNHYGYTIASVESCAEDAKFSTEVFIDSMLFVNRTEMRQYEQAQREDS